MKKFADMSSSKGHHFLNKKNFVGKSKFSSDHSNAGYHGNQSQKSPISVKAYFGQLNNDIFTVQELIHMLSSIGKRFGLIPSIVKVKVRVKGQGQIKNCQFLTVFLPMPLFL